MTKKRALISVSDKNGLEEFAKALLKHDYEIISTGGTARFLKEKNMPVTLVEEVTEFQEMLDGRVKTLHPKVHAGILALRDSKDHMKQLEGADIFLIDLVVVNLYPFRETVDKNSENLDEIIENIDIGGPTLIRSAAKNYRDVAVVVSPKQYPKMAEELDGNKGVIPLTQRRKLAATAFRHTAGYDVAIEIFLNRKFNQKQKFPKKLNLSFDLNQKLRYGENWHQEAAFYSDLFPHEPCIATAEQIQGKEMSYNNINDTDSAIELSKDFEEPCAVIVKHANPCGTAVAKDLHTAFEKALASDPVSAFGGIISLNGECDAKTAERITSFFNEIVAAPSYSKEALEIFSKKKNLRVLLLKSVKNSERGKMDFKKVTGGLLLQDRDMHELSKKDLKFVTKEKPSAKQLEDMLFGWKIIKHVKSNAILLVKDKATIGVGAGQMSRIDSTEIAVKKAGERAKESVLISDAFFPFRDNVDLAAKSGITAIIQPGGSVNDGEVIRAADEHGITMVFTGVRHFKH